MSFPSSAPCAPRAAFGLCLALSALGAPALSAQSLEPIVIVGSREPQPLDRVTADVVLIDSERIRNSTADSLEDLLRREAGVQISRAGGPSKAAGVMIRGASVDSTVVLVDGVRIGSATLGQVEFESLNLAMIDHIEVLRGPGSSLYGADAMGGVVQIYTRRGEGAPRVVGDAAAGGYRSYDGSLGVSGSASGFDYAASVSHEQSEGISTLRPGDAFGSFNPDSDGYHRTTGQLRLGVTPTAGHRVGIDLIDSRLNAQYDGSQFLPPDFVQDATPDFRNRLHTQIAALDYRGEIGAHWATSLQASHAEDELKSGADVISRFVTRRDQLTWQNAWKPSADQQLVAAYEHLRERVATDSISGASRDNNALVVGYSAKLGAQLLQADLRYDHNSVYGAVTTGRLGWSMALAPNWRVRALYGTTFRAPSFNDLFFPGYGIDTIKPEHGRSAELGLAWQAGGAEASATLFQNRVRDMIEFVSDRSLCPADPSYGFGCAGNVGRARLQGVTLAGAQKWGAFSLRGSVDFLDAKDAATDQRLNRRAAHQESLVADYDAGAWSAGAALLNVGSRPDGTVQLGSYALLDLHASWRVLPQWRIEAKLLNATDRDYQPLRDYQSLGRQAWIGVRYDGQGL